MQRYDSGGVHISAFNGSSSPEGAFTELTDIALDASGDVIVASAGTAQRFGPNGGHQLTITNFSAGLLASDPVSGHTLVLGAHHYSQSPTISAYDGKELVVEAIPPDAQGTLGGLAFDPTQGSRLYMVRDAFSEQIRYGYVGIDVFEGGVSAAVEIDDPIPGSTEAAVSGSVNPQGQETEWYFEYSKAGADRWYPSPYPFEAAGDGATAVPVAHTIEGLHPSTDYEVRLVAVNQAGKSVTSIEAFSTANAAPSATGIFAAPRTTTTARLNARINPQGEASTYYFEWGTDESYGASVPATLDGVAGSGIVPVIVAEGLTGLAPETTYHYRVVTENASGTTVSADHVFETRSASEMVAPERGIELVSQPDKGGQDIKFPAVSADDSGVFWQTWGGAPGVPISLSFFRSERSLDTPRGWSSESLLPPYSELTPNVTYALTAQGISSDGRGLILTSRDSGELLANFERTTHTTNEVLETLQFASVSPTPLHGTFGSQGMESSDDLSRVYVNTSQSLDPEHVSSGGPGGSFNIYEIAEGAPRLVSRMPDGSVPSCGLTSFGFSSYPAYAGIGFKTSWVTPDGSKLLFASSGDRCGEYSSLYLRDVDAETTTPLSGPSSGPFGPPSAEGPEGRTWPIGLADDGSEVLFMTKARPVTDDENASMDIYRWAEGDGSECLTCTTSVRIQTAVASDDLSRVYFTSRDQLVAGEGEEHASERTNLYRWHDGRVKYVAPVADTTMPWNRYHDMDLSADGSVIAFATDAVGVTADTTACVGKTCQHIYRYDDRGGEIECVDCGRPSDAIEEQIFPERGFPNLPRARSVSADGSTFVFRSNNPLLPEDINGGPDLYQWRNGAVSLTTDGTKKFSSLALVGISADATDIHFVAGGPRLTGFEVDRSTQLYDARIGGGFAPPTPPAECVEDACQGPLTPSPSLQGSGSASFAGAANASGGGQRKGCKNRKKANRKGKARCGKQRKGQRERQKRNSNRRGG